METYRVETGGNEWWLTAANHKQAGELALHDSTGPFGVMTMVTAVTAEDDEPLYFATANLLDYKLKKKK
jgi:hypothetical protein